MKICSYCKKDKEETDFRKSRNICKKCEYLKTKDKQKEWKENNREHHLTLQKENWQIHKNRVNLKRKEKYNTNIEYRNQIKKISLKNNYNITLEEYNQLFESQNGKCAICNKEQQNKLLAVDHNHNTNQIRGLLCSKCNLALGLFYDNINNLKAAILYLKGNQYE
jgi:hypothetical protein